MAIEDGLYPEITPYATHRLAVDPPHTLHVEECGNPAGIPALFLHGGPGAGAKSAQRRTFDPARFRAVLFDQRGCGRSTPSAELSDNTTAHLIADIEAIRTHLGIERWLVTGGSWGSFLGLAYAIAHPDRVLGLRLHGIFLGDPDAIRFWFHGIGQFFPDAFEAFAEYVPAAERDDLLAAYYRRLIDPDPAVHQPAALALRGFSARTQTLLPNVAHVNALTAPQTALEISRLFTHYCINGCFMLDGALLAGIDRIRHLPAEIVQGRYDVVTPMAGAWALHKAWPEARLTRVDLANHVATPEAPALNAALAAATDRLADRLAGLGPDIGAYLVPRAHHSPTVSDDGTLLAWISDETGFDQLWTRPLDTEGARPALRLALPEKVGAVAFRPGSRDIVLSTDTGGDERHQIWLLPEGATQARPLASDPRWVHEWGCFSPDGARVAFASNARDARHMDIHMRDIATGQTRCIVKGTGWRTPMRFTPDGTALLVQDNTAGMYDSSLTLHDLDSGASRVLLPQGGRAHINGVRWVDSGQGLLLVTDAGREFHGLTHIDTATATLRWLATPEADIDLFALAKSETLAALVLNDGGTSRLVMHDLGSGDSHPVAGVPAGRITALAFTAGDTALVLCVNAFDRPARVLHLDLATAQLRVLAEGAFELAPDDVMHPNIVSIPSFDGHDVPAFVYEPRQPAEGRPAMVIVHGGPESQYAAGWRPEVQYLVRRGWTVVAPNVRGSTGYGRTWQAADDRELRMDSVRDLKAVRDWVAALPGVDPNRLVVHGQSYGGFMVLAALTEYPRDWCAGVDFYGIADFNTLLATTGPWRRTLRAVEYGDPDTAEGAAMLANFSPMRRIDRIAAPLFIAHATDDPRVVICESEMVYAALRGRGHPVEYLRVAHEGHGFARQTDRACVFGAMARFLHRVTSGDASI